MPAMTFWLMRCVGDEVEPVAGPLLDESQLDDAVIAMMSQDIEDQITHDPPPIYFGLGRDSRGDFESIMFDPEEIAWFEVQAAGEYAEMLEDAQDYQMIDGEIVP